jgi:hypothetical protein
MARRHGFAGRDPTATFVRRWVVLYEMYEVVCPECGYRVGVGTFNDPGDCPSCDLPLMLTAEFRALPHDDLIDEAVRRKKIEALAR